MLSHGGMTLEIVSEISGRSYRIRPRELGKLLHLARLEGWQPERVPSEWPSDSWETEMRELRSHELWPRATWHGKGSYNSRR